jgi:hypothetical protein
VSWVACTLIPRERGADNAQWMGYFLLYESMLDTVLLARDKYLVSHSGARWS